MKNTQISEYNQTAAALAVLNQKYHQVQFDVRTTAGMKSAIEARADLRGYRVNLEKLRKEIKAPALERCRLIDEEAKQITAQLVALEDPIDRQIKAEEARKEAEKQAKIEAERKRVADIRDRIASIKNHPASFAGKSSHEIREEADRISGADLLPGGYDEFLPDAEKALVESIQQMQEMASAAHAREEEQARIKAEQEAEATRIAAERAELEQLRKEQAEKDAELKRLRDAEEARVRAELQKEESRLKAEREEQERIHRANQERIDKERADAIRIRQEQEAEAARLDAQRKRIEAEQKAADDRRKRLQKARRDTPEKALSDILEICRNSHYSDCEARNDIELIAEASIG